MNKSLFSNGTKALRAHTQRAHKADHTVLAPRATMSDSCATCSSPLLALGVLSAQDYLERRMGIRQSWGRYEQIKSGEVLLRFVIGFTGAEPASVAARARSEHQKYSDIQMLPVRITGRKLGPMHTTFAWLQHSTTNLPYSAAAYVAKLDDDCFINLPELSRHLVALKHLPKVYYGIFYYSTWEHRAYSHKASGYTTGSLRSGHAGECMRSGACSGAFPFAAAPAQILSTDLASALATSPQAINYTDSSLAILNDPRLNTSKAFATEDAWIGYAIHDLLPSSFSGVTLAMLDRYAYTWDTWGAEMRNTTVLFHNKVKEQTRIKSAYYYMREYACPTNVSIRCSAGTAGRYASQCHLSPHNSSCRMVRQDVRKTNYMLCQYYSVSRIAANPKLNRFCLGQRDDYNESMIKSPPPPPTPPATNSGEAR